MNQQVNIENVENQNIQTNYFHQKKSLKRQLSQSPIKKFKLVSNFNSNQHIKDQQSNFFKKLSTIDQICPDVSQVFSHVNHLRSKLSKLQLLLDIKQQQLALLKQHNQQKDKIIKKMKQMSNFKFDDNQNRRFSYDHSHQYKHNCNYNHFENLKLQFQNFKQFHTKFIEKAQTQKKQNQALRLQNQGKLLSQIYQLKQKLRIQQKQNNLFSSSQGVNQFQKKLRQVVKQVLNNQILQKQILQQCQKCPSLKKKIEELQRIIFYLKQQNKQLKNGVDIKFVQTDLLKKSSGMEKFQNEKMNSFRQTILDNNKNTYNYQKKQYYKDKDFYKKLLTILKSQTLERKYDLYNMNYQEKDQIKIQTNSNLKNIENSNNSQKIQKQKRKPKQSLASTENYSSIVQKQDTKINRTIINNLLAKQNQEQFDKKILIRNSSQVNTHINDIRPSSFYLNSYKSQQKLKIKNLNENIQKNILYQDKRNNQYIQNRKVFINKPINFEYKTENKENDLFLREKFLQPVNFPKQKFETKIQFLNNPSILKRPRINTVISTSIIFK